MSAASFKAEVRVYGEASYNGNGLRFATHAEAESYAVDLAWRWVLVADWRVVDSPEPANYRFAEGKLEAIK